MPTILAFLSQLTEPTQLNLARQLEAVTIEVSTVQALRLRTNPWKVNKVKYMPPEKVTYSHTGFTMAKLASLT